MTKSLLKKNIDSNDHELKLVVKKQQLHCAQELENLRETRTFQIAHYMQNRILKDLL